MLLEKARLANELLAKPLNSLREGGAGYWKKKVQESLKKNLKRQDY